MHRHHIFVGVPVYHGWDYLEKSLRSLMEQDFGSYHAVISVDGDDARSAGLCARIVSGDPRFEIVLQRQHLGWAANLNWLIARCTGEFFQYWQQDDYCSNSYLRCLLDHAAAHPETASVYGDVEWFGTREEIEALPSVTGPALQRVLQQIESGSSVPFRGLIRASSLEGAGLLRVNQYDSRLEDFVWVAKLAREGELHRVPEARYYKRVHTGNAHSHRPMHDGLRRGAWVEYGIGLLEAVLPLVNAEGKLDVLVRVMERLLVARQARWATYDPSQEGFQGVIRFANEFLQTACERMEAGLPVSRSRLSDPRMIEILRSHSRETPGDPLTRLADRETQFRTLQQTLEREGYVELRFAAGEPGTTLLEEGWSSPEDWGVWSDGTRATIRLPLLKINEAWLLKFRAHGFTEGMGTSEARSVTVLIPGSPPTQWNFAKSNSNYWSEIDVIVSPGRRGAPVEFHLPGVTSPTALGLADDLRLLGIALESLVIERHTQGETRSSFKPLPPLAERRQISGEMDLRSPESWYKGEYCFKYPFNRELTAPDILQSWIPDIKLIGPSTKVLAFGSCFAEYFISFLAEYGFNRWQLPPEERSWVDVDSLLPLPLNFENVFVVLQHFRWVFGEFNPEAKLWFTKEKKHYEATESRRERARTGFAQSDVIIVTFGLSEVWWDETQHEPLWRAIPLQHYETGRYSLKLATASETLAALHEIDRIADAFLQDKKFVFTLSPIPFAATFRNQSPVTANEASKAVLKVALDEFFSNPLIRAKRRYYYFPSYELTFELFDHPFDTDGRHVRPEVARTMTNIFGYYYTELPLEPPPDSYRSGYVASLRDRCRDLEQQLAAREQVIRDLDQVARERLELLQRLEGKS